MSIILQIGQCGNQLGQKVFQDLYKEIQCQKKHKLKNHFFHHNSKQQLTANCVMIDMEPKVINSLICDQNQEFIFNKKFSFSQEEGSGNNWAYGYYKHGQKNKEQILNKIQCLLERLDYVENFIFIQSLAGGTGSGLGSYLTEVIQDYYSQNFSFAFLIAPQIGGEVIIQNYNTVFSLSQIYQNVDNIIILQNDRARQICKKLFELKKIDLSNLNEVLAKNIVSTLMSQNSQQNFVDILQQNLTVFPRNKLIENKFLPHLNQNLQKFFTDNWQSLIRRMLQIQINGSSEANINWQMNPQTSPNMCKTLGSFLQLYSVNDEPKLKEFGQENFEFQNQKIYHQNLLRPNFTYSYQKQNLYDIPISLNLLTNSQEFQPILKLTLNKAKTMYGQKAYVYQYEKYGLSYYEMEKKFLLFSSIIEAYENFQLYFLQNLIESQLQKQK